MKLACLFCACLTNLYGVVSNIEVNTARVFGLFGGGGGGLHCPMVKKPHKNILKNRFGLGENPSDLIDQRAGSFVK